MARNFSGGYDPGKDVVVYDYGVVQIDGTRYDLKVRSYNEGAPKFVVEAFGRRQNGIPAALAVYLAREGILEDFAEGIFGKKIEQIEQEVVEFEPVE